MFNGNRKRLSAEVFYSGWFTTKTKREQPKPRREWQHNAEKHKGKASASRVRTVVRRLREFGLSCRAVYSLMSDEQLDTIMLSILAEFPETGYKRMTGFLKARGIVLQQSRIREAMRRVNPEGTLSRALRIQCLNRRSYQVASPLALWHIDGNHKLIR